jgi:hypothetical protein
LYYNANKESTVSIMQDIRQFTKAVCCMIAGTA